MSNFTPISKSSTVTATPLTKSSVTLGRVAKAGSGWLYDQAGLTYDGATDPVSGLPVFYDAEGTLPVWVTLVKS